MKTIIAALLTVLIANVAFAASEVTVAHRTFSVSVAVGHDTSAYTAGDALSAAFTLSDVAREQNPTGLIVGASLIDDAAQGADTTLYLYSSAVTASANAAYDPTDAQQENFICAITFDTHASFTDNGISYPSSVVSCPFVSTSGSLSGVLVTAGTPTYTASALTLKLTVSQD